VVYSSYEFTNNVKSTGPPDLSQLENKAYADVALEKRRLKLYQELGFDIRCAFTYLENKIDSRMTAFENKIDARMTSSDLKMEVRMDTRLNSIEGKLNSIDEKLSALITVWTLGAAGIGTMITILLGGIATTLMKLE